MSLTHKLMLIFSLLLLWDGKMSAENKLSEAHNLAIIKKREETISQLIANFNKSNDKEYKRSIIYTLGKLRAIEAIPFLINNIKYGNYGSIRPIPRYGVEPAANALSKIGIPAIIPILNAIKKTDDHFTVCYLTNALVDINGHDLATFYLQKEMNKTKNADELAKLKNALKIIIRYAPKTNSLD